jgi:calcineurin-like phosphoesterase family protein
MTFYFSSDFHGFHINISGPKLSKWKSGYRNFNSIQEMNQAIIDSVNLNVKREDVLYYLGDWSFGGKENIPRLRERLNVETIHFILGNHDQHIEEYKDLFTTVKSYDEINIEGQHICLFHYPIASFHKEHRGSWCLCGHSHGMFPGSRENYLDKKILDVGWDNFKKPLAFSEIKTIMDKKRFKPVDGHKER